MQPIFFAWLGDYDSLVATGFYSLSKRTRTVAITHGSAYIGVIEAPTAAVRPALAALSPNLVVLPGATGTLGAAHVAQLAKVAPALKARQGDPMRAVLSYVYALFGDGEFDPDGH